MNYRIKAHEDTSKTYKTKSIGDEAFTYIKEKYQQDNDVFTLDD